METNVMNTSDRILTLIKQKGTMSFTELEDNLDDSYNVIFLAIDKLVRENKITLERKRTEYLLSTKNFISDLTGIIQNHVI